MKLIIFNVCILFPVFTWAQTCQLEDVLKQYERYVAQEKTMAALSYLENAYAICPHPRLLLEQGEIYLKHNQVERALEVWEEVLTLPNLPDSVSKNIKLRVVQQRLAEPKSTTFQTIATVNQEWDQQAISGVGLSALLQDTRSLIGFYGYPMQHGLFAKVSGNSRYLWESEMFSSASLASIGWRANSNPLTTVLGPSIRTVNDEFFFTLDASVTLRVENIAFQQAFEFSLNDEPHEWQQELTVDFGRSRFKTAMELEVFEAELIWNEADLSLQGKGRLRPELIVRYEPEDAVWRPEAGIRWFASRQVWLDLNAGTRLTEEPSWYAEFSMSWRPF